MKYTLVLFAGTMLLLAGCTEDARQAQGFSLPEGDIESGQLVYIEMRCNDCHLVADIPQETGDQAPEFSIKLGGKVRSIKTYGNLVTSVINPSHRIAPGQHKDEVTGPGGESRMRNYNDVMTVQELVDLVAFLESEYELQPYPRSKFYPYDYNE